MAEIKSPNELLDILNEYKEKLTLLKIAYLNKQNMLDKDKNSIQEEQKEEVAIDESHTEEVNTQEQEKVETQPVEEVETPKVEVEEKVEAPSEEKSTTFTTETGKKVYINPAFQQNKGQNSIS